ncbi:MAG: chitobiase/beta-hexosaminidase C-terminal domain-containing protein [Fibrobacteria bacterium]
MRLMVWLGLLLFLEMPFGQPATLTLRAKLRDFKDFRPSDPTTHPDFENDLYMGCGGTDLGYVRNTIALDGPMDTTLFRGDNRGPVLQKLAPTGNPTAKCFTSIEKFGDWYNDNPAVNRKFYTDLVLTRNAQGIYSFNDDNFLPLNQGAGWRKFQPADPDPFGPRPDITPNDVWGFTMELHTTFTYVAGQKQVFSFKGDDDVWVFINDRLAIDLGGLHPQLTSTVNLDAQAVALGLVDGGSYPLDFFFAERHSTGSHCQITTSLQLVQTPQLPIPVAAPAGRTFSSSIQVAVTVPGHPDAQIRYTTDGTEPTATSPTYPVSLTFSGNTTLKAKAFETNFQPSPTLTEVYTLEQVKLPAPIATPPGKTFQLSLSVGLAVPGHSDAAIRYTTDGTDPILTSPLYSSALAFTSGTVLKARAFKTGWLQSDVMTENYILEKLKLPAPVADPRGQVFDISIAVTLTVPGYPDAVIRYTLDGRDPDSTSPAYSSTLTFTASDTVKARAFKAGWLASEAMVEIYPLRIPPNVITLRMDSTLIRKGEYGVAGYPDQVLKRPIAVVSVSGGATQCLECPAGAQDIFLKPGQFPEWVVSSRYPFHYFFQIYDHLGQFVLSQDGEITQEMLGRTLGDASGYRGFSFRWAPVAHNGVAVGTGAYILRGKVVDIPLSPSAGQGRSEMNLLKKFGFVRSR